MGIINKLRHFVGLATNADVETLLEGIINIEAIIPGVVPDPIPDETENEEAYITLWRMTQKAYDDIPETLRLEEAEKNLRILQDHAKKVIEFVNTNRNQLETAQQSFIDSNFAAWTMDEFKVQVETRLHSLTEILSKQNKFGDYDLDDLGSDEDSNANQTAQNKDQGKSGSWFSWMNLNNWNSNKKRNDTLQRINAIADATNLMSVRLPNKDELASAQLEKTKLAELSGLIDTMSFDLIRARSPDSGMSVHAIEAMLQQKARDLFEFAKAQENSIAQEYEAFYAWAEIHINSSEFGNVVEPVPFRTNYQHALTALDSALNASVAAAPSNAAVAAPATLIDPAEPEGLNPEQIEQLLNAMRAIPTALIRADNQDANDIAENFDISLSLLLDTDLDVEAADKIVQPVIDYLNRQGIGGEGNLPISWIPKDGQEKYQLTVEATEKYQHVAAKIAKQLEKENQEGGWWQSLSTTQKILLTTGIAATSFAVGYAMKYTSVISNWNKSTGATTPKNALETANNQIPVAAPSPKAIEKPAANNSNAPNDAPQNTANTNASQPPQDIPL